MYGINPVLSKYNDKFSISSLNIQSINNKFDSFLAIISELNRNDLSYGVSCLQETWLPEDTKVNDVVPILVS